MRSLQLGNLERESVPGGDLVGQGPPYGAAVSGALCSGVPVR
ncbi:MAG: hypothetical protein V2I67_20125 [Thermoanaerobaculales bacterium]|nr:hypothetical protein [Thermoanaerobaculales bacterium]